MTRETTGDNLKDIIEAMGGKPEGKTSSELLDQIEHMIAEGEVPSGDVAAAIEAYLAAHEGSISDEQMDEVFGE